MTGGFQGFQISGSVFTIFFTIFFTDYWMVLMSLVKNQGSFPCLEGEFLNFWIGLFLGWAPPGKSTRTCAGAMSLRTGGEIIFHKMVIEDGDPSFLVIPT